MAETEITFRDRFSLPVFVAGLAVAAFTAFMLFLSLQTREFTPPALTPSLQRLSGTVFLQGQYEIVSSVAKNSQPIFTGDVLETGEDSYAEIVFDDNVVRLDQNSKVILLSAYSANSSSDRLSLRLERGNVWVNAFDPIRLESAHTAVTFSHAIGAYSYHQPLNRLMVMRGYADVALVGANQNPLVSTLLPLGYQIAYSDDQLVSDYALLETSKLRKELKQARLTKDLMEDAWVMRNTTGDESRFADGVRYVFSGGLYNLRNRLYSLQAPLVVTPAAKERFQIRWAQLKMNYVLGGLHRDNNLTDAQKVLEEWSFIAEKLQDSPEFKRQNARQFYAILNVHPASPAFAAHAALRSFLQQDGDPAFMRTYLTDADSYIRNNQMSAAAGILQDWQAAWGPALRKQFAAEFEKQTRLLDGILLVSADKVIPSMMTVADAANQSLLASAVDRDEALLSLIQSRLDMVRGFLNVYRYSDAKNYLRTIYQELAIESLPDTLAAKQLFLKQAILIADRIDYAETALRGAAMPINEADFQTYLKNKREEAKITTSLREFLEGATTPATPELVLPSVPDVVQAFASARFLVLSDDITVSPQDPFEFTVKNARLLDRTPDGATVLIDGQFDSRSSGIYDVQVNGQPLSGSYTLNDLRTLLLTPKAVDTVAPSLDSIGSLISDTELEEAQRAQIVAQDLAKQLLIKELGAQGIQIATALQIDLLDPSTLTRFLVRQAVVGDPANPAQSFTIQFNYDLDTKLLTNIQETQRGFTLQGGYPAGQVADALLQALEAQEAEIQARKAFQLALDRHALLVNAADLTFVGSDLNRAGFVSARFKNLPITLEGMYDRNADVFTEVRHELLNRSEPIDVRTYMDELTRLYVAEYLKIRQLAVTTDQITVTFPYAEIRVTGFSAGGRIYDFSVDVSNNRLKNVSLQGSGSQVSSMTFEEFRRLTGIPETTGFLPQNLLAFLGL